MRWRSAALAKHLAVFGPGLVFLLAVVGMGDFVTNAALGAAHGYAFLWLLAVGVAFRFVWLDTSARYVLTTGEGLIEGLARLGRPFVIVLFCLAPVLGHLLNVGRIVLFGQMTQLLLPLPVAHGAAWYSVGFSGIALLATLRGGYPWLEAFSKWLVCFLGFGLFVAAALSHPNPALIVRGLIPSIPPTTDVKATLLMVTALIGTEAGSVTNLTYASFLHAKGWRDRSALVLQRRDLVLSVVAIFMVGLLTQIAAANTLLGTNVRLESASDLVQVVAGRLGIIGVTLFTIGLGGKIFSSAVGRTTGYSLVITELGRRYIPWFADDGPDRAGHYRRGDRDRMFEWTAALLLLSPLYVLLTDWQPVTLVLVGQGAQLILMPVLSVALVRLTRDRNRMGEHPSGLLRTSLLLLIAAVSLWFLWRNAVARIV